MQSGLNHKADDNDDDMCKKCIQPLNEGYVCEKFSVQDNMTRSPLLISHSKKCFKQNLNQKYHFRFLNNSVSNLGNLN